MEVSDSKSLAYKLAGYLPFCEKPQERRNLVFELLPERFALRKCGRGHWHVLLICPQDNQLILDTGVNRWKHHQVFRFIVDRNGQPPEWGETYRDPIFSVTTLPIGDGKVFELRTKVASRTNVC